MTIDKRTIDALVKEHDSPVYYFDEDQFIANYYTFEKSFTDIYSNYRVSYSYKTNYAPYICRIVKGLGGYAEVVSDMELEIAREVGYPNREIVYNGPCKGTLCESHILNGGITNIDNFEELKTVLAMAVQHPKDTYKFGLRVNIDIGQSFISRFGIDECDLGTAFSMVRDIRNAEIVGLHCHIGRSRSREAWGIRIRKMLELSDQFFQTPPDYLSLGSGMYGVMDEVLARQFSKDIPSYQQYAETVAGAMAGHFQGGKRPILFTEPGTTLINKYVSFITTVKAIKRIKGKTFIVLDGSKHNIGEICELKQLPVAIVHCGEHPETLIDADFVGYTCLEHDVLYRGFHGEIAVGDFIVFDNVGGYSNVSKPPFIMPNCAMVSSSGAVIKRRETVKEIICTYE